MLIIIKGFFLVSACISVIKGLSGGAGDTSSPGVVFRSSFHRFQVLIFKFFMYFEGKADAGDFGPRIAKVNKTGRPDGRRLFGNGSISYGGVKKRIISGRCADLRRVPSGQNETSLPVARGDGGKVSAGRCGRCSGGYESTRYS